MPGAPGHVENCVSTVFTAWVTTSGQAWADFDVFMPERWAKDWRRRRAAAIPGKLERKTKKTVRGTGRVLRGRSAELVRQEAWALLLAHNMTASEPPAAPPPSDGNGSANQPTTPSPSSRQISRKRTEVPEVKGSGHGGQ
jgi:hypothetical protein